MNQPYNDNDALFSSIYSDGTALFRQPVEPKPWDYVGVRLRIRPYEAPGGAGSAKRVA